MAGMSAQPVGREARNALLRALHRHAVLLGEEAALALELEHRLDSHWGMFAKALSVIIGGDRAAFELEAKRFELSNDIMLELIRISRSQLELEHRQTSPVGLAGESAGPRPS